MRLRAIVVVAAIAAVTLSPTAAAEQSTVELPRPTGSHQVGSTTIHLVDQSRPDPWHPERDREVMVTVTYPARHAGAFPRAPWMSDAMAEVVDEEFTKIFGSAPNTVPWASIDRHARAGAMVDRRGGERPVVLFSPGYGSPREVHAVLIDDLASRGYIVVSMSHTYETPVEFPGGRIVPADPPRYDDASMKIALDARVADTRFVLDSLERIDQGANPDVDRKPLPVGLRGALDMDKVGMFGHSYGGFTSGETMVHDGRIDAGMNLDGAMYFGRAPYQAGLIATRGVDRPFALVGGFLSQEDGSTVPHDHRPGGLDPSWADFWAVQRGWKRDITLVDGAHHSFSDLQAVLPQVADKLDPTILTVALGTIDPARSVLIQNTYTAAYFDLHLRQRDAQLWDGPSERFPEVSFVS